MDCPNDGAVLLVVHPSGVEIDYCPACRGVWLDRGELDKLITLALTPSRLVKPPSLHPFRRKKSTPPNPHSGPPDTPEESSWLADLFDTPPPNDSSIDTDTANAAMPPPALPPEEDPGAQTV